MKARHLLSVVLLALILASTIFVGLPHAESLTSYAWLTNYETTEFDEIIWFWTPDTFWGPVRSNDYIGLKYSPTFFDRVITSKERFVYYQPGNIFFAEPPSYNAMPYNFPDGLPHLRQMADPVIDDDDGHLMTEVDFQGDDGLYFYQYPIGRERNRDNLILHLEDPEGRVIYIDGKADIEGVVSGRMTLAAAHDIGLRDNIRYIEAQGDMGLVDPEQANSMLGIVSEQNIIIRDTYRNGKENGKNVDRNDFNRHSIVINAALVAIHGSFTFEHQNDDWEAFQGPSPDERGSIFLTGSTIQYRRGYLHRSNHNGTGYGKSFHYDQRFRREAPPGLEPDEVPELSGYYERLVLDKGPYTLTSVSTPTLIVKAGVTLQLNGSTLSVTDTLKLLGEEDSPITIISINGDSRILAENIAPVLEITHTHIENSIECILGSNTVNLVSSNIDGDLWVEGNGSITSCKFTRNIGISVRRNFYTERTVYKGGLSLNGSAANITISNCNFVSSNNEGLTLRGNLETDITNSIFAWNRAGVVNNTRNDVVLRYCNFFDNYEDMIDCEIGEGRLDSDPRIFDRDSDNYHLREDSPCIDAGNPLAPTDPDGTRPEIGAFHFPQLLGVERESMLQPGQLSLSVSPNPFNSVLTIRFDVGVRHAVPLQIVIHDLSGREITRLIDSSSPTQDSKLTSQNFIWDASSVPAGIYLVRLQSGSEIVTRKVALIR